MPDSLEYSRGQILGWLNTAPTAGALATELLVAHLPLFRRAGRTMLIGVAGFGRVTIVFEISTSFWLSWAMLFLAGA